MLWCNAIYKKIAAAVKAYSRRGYQIWKNWKTSYSLPGAALTNYHKAGGKNNSDVFSRHSEGQKSETQVSVDMVLSRGSEISSVPFSRLLLVVTNSWCSLACWRLTLVSASFIQASFPVSVCVQIFLFLKAHYFTVFTGLRLTLIQ